MAPTELQTQLLLMSPFILDFSLISSGEACGLFTIALSWFSKWLLLYPFILRVEAALEARVPDHPQMGPLDQSVSLSL